VTTAAVYCFAVQYLCLRSFFFRSFFSSIYLSFFLFFVLFSFSFLFLYSFAFKKIFFLSSFFFLPFFISFIVVPIFLTNLHSLFHSKQTWLSHAVYRMDSVNRQLLFGSPSHSSGVLHPQTFVAVATHML